MTGISVAVDIYSCWYERGFENLVRDSAEMISLVQVCDYTVGTFNILNRSVPGDGNIPLERCVSQVLDAGYAGVFDLEILGPRIDEEGYLEAISRSVETMNEILERLGV